MTSTRLALLLSCGLAALTTFLACAPCADCCPPGPTTTPVTVACRVVRSSGAAASGVSARCVQSDAGATTDGDGGFSFSVNRLSCGIAAGSTDCNSVQFFEDGGLLTVAPSTSPDAGGTVASSAELTGGSCELIAR